jgi:hypothetical protein
MTFHAAAPGKYPIWFCYPMIIYKIQGPKLDKVGIYLSKTMYLHGQYYVAPLMLLPSWYMHFVYSVD